MNHRRLFRPLAILVVAAGAWPLPAAAAIVTLGSTYDLRTDGRDSGTFGMTGAVFDGNSQTFLRDFGGGNVMKYQVDESQTDLGHGAWRVRVTISTDSDMFFGLGTEFGGGSIGLGGNVLDLTAPLRVTSAFMRLTDAAGTEYTSPDQAANIFAPSPWDGAFLVRSTSGGPPTPATLVLGGIGAYDVRRLAFDINLGPAITNDVPEPASLPLVAAALVGVMWARRVAHRRH